MNSRLRISNLVVLAFVLFLFVLPLFLKSIYWMHILILVWINVLLAVSLRTISRTNQFSLGHAGFMAIGAYASALLMKAGIPFWFTFFMGGLLAAFVALAVGYPFLRVKGIYFAILTLLLAEVFRLIALYWESLTGGITGLAGIESPASISFPSLGTIDFYSKIAYYYLVLVIVLSSLVILYRLEHSRLGSIWGAIKESDVLARAVGINIMWHKMFIFAVGCFFAGIAGSLFAHFMHVLSPGGAGGGIFGAMSSIFIMIYMVVGGEEKFGGPIIGAALLTLVPEFARPLKEYQPLIFGGVLIFVVFLMPEGIVGLGSRFSRYYRALSSRQTVKEKQDIA